VCCLLVLDSVTSTPQWIRMEASEGRRRRYSAGAVQFLALGWVGWVDDGMGGWVDEKDGWMGGWVDERDGWMVGGERG
jgi:hypothetical protein